MSDSVRPHRRQPTRLPCSWDSPGKNTGVGCHFLLQCMKVKSESEVAQSSPTLRSHGLQPSRLLHPWDFPGKSTGVGCHRLLCLLLLVWLNIRAPFLFLLFLSIGPYLPSEVTCMGFKGQNDPEVNLFSIPGCVALDKRQL